MAHQFHRIFITILLFPHTFAELSQIANKEIIKFIQSSRFETTTVFFIVDNGNFFETENAYDILKLFSEGKTFYLQTLPHLKMEQFMQNANTIEKLKLSKGELFENGNKTSNEPKGAEFLRNGLNGDKAEQVQQRNFFQWKNFKLIKNNLSDTNSIVYIIRNLTALRSIMEEFQKNPSLIKIVYIYDECQENVRFIRQPIMEFSINLWTKYRSMYTYFIVDCPAVHGISPITKPVPELKPNTNKMNESMPFHRDINSTFLYKKINNIIRTRKFINSMYVYDPFSKESDGSNGNKGVVYGELKEIDLSGDVQEDNILKKKFRLNGYNVKILFFNNSAAIFKTEVNFLARELTPEVLANQLTSIEAFFGMEADILLELAKLMDFKFEIGPPTDNMFYGFKTENGTFNGGLGDILERRYEFGLNGYFIKDYETTDLEFALSIQDDKLCILVQTPPLLPNSVLLFKVFSGEVWLLLLGTFAFASILYSYLLRFVELLKDFEFPYGFEKTLPFKSANMFYNQFSAIASQCTRIVAVILNAPLAYGFESSSYERVFVSLFLLLGLNVMGSFQGSLVDVYTTARSYPSINTLEELDESGIPIYVRHQGLIVDLFGANPQGKPLGSLRQKLVPTEDENLNYHIATEGEMGGLARLTDYTRISLSVPYRKDGEVLLHLLKDCPKSYTIGYIFPKSSVFLETINYYLLLLASNGLARKWESDMINVFKFEADLRNRLLSEDAAIVLTVSHLQVAFFMLCFGCALGIFMFIIELRWEKQRIKN